MNANEKPHGDGAQQEADLIEEKAKKQNDLPAADCEADAASSEAPQTNKKSPRKTQSKKNVSKDTSDKADSDKKISSKNVKSDIPADDSITETDVPKNSTDEESAGSGTAFESIFESDAAEADLKVENQTSLPLFSISAEGFDTYERNTKDFGIQIYETVTDEDNEDKILPPDELFAFGLYKQNNEDEPEVYDEAEMPSDEAVKADEVEDDLDDDAQYAISDSELQVDEHDKSYADEEISKYDPQKPRRIDGRFDLVELFVFTLLAVMIITSFLFKHSIVEGSSMEDTLHGGEHLIISDLFYTPKRGDIIVCEANVYGEVKPIVKRVIAVAGDHVKIDIIQDKSGKLREEVRINGVLQDEKEYVTIDGPLDILTVDKVIDENEIFVMGDHRNNSADSRYEEIGTISVDAVLGKVLLRFYPFDKFGTVE